MDEGDKRGDDCEYREKRGGQQRRALVEGLRRDASRRRGRRNSDGGQSGRSPRRGARGKRATEEVNGLWNTAVIKSRE